MSDQESLKKRIQAGESIRVIRVGIDVTRSHLEDILSRGACDLFFVDCQHGPFNEIELLRLCNTAEELGVPVKVRIKHPRQAYLLGNYLDLGPLSLMVPLVEDEETVIEAINSFYFPPLGKRSWGAVGYKLTEGRDRLEYAEWWNNNGILCFQFESIKAIVNARKLVKPGVDWISFGPNDLEFDLEMHSHSPFKTVDECKEYVVEQLKETQICIR
jgi:2-keto-3-deoxy-L-rhamnonate aldolase RhmA